MVSRLHAVGRRICQTSTKTPPLTDSVLRTVWSTPHFMLFDGVYASNKQTEGIVLK